MRGLAYLGNPRKVVPIGLLLFLFFFAHHLTRPWEANLAFNEGIKAPAKPEGVIVSGLVFYGRRDRASCMLCYLQVGSFLNLSSKSYS